MVDTPIFNRYISPDVRKSVHESLRNVLENCLITDLERVISLSLNMGIHCRRIPSFFTLEFALKKLHTVEMETNR